MFPRFINPFYSPPIKPDFGTASPITLNISTNISNLSYWSQYYMRQYPRLCHKFPEKVEKRGAEMFTKIQDLSYRIDLLSKENETLKDKLRDLHESHDLSNSNSSHTLVTYTNTTNDPLCNPLKPETEEELHEEQLDLLPAAIQTNDEENKHDELDELDEKSTSPSPPSLDIDEFEIIDNAASSVTDINSDQLSNADFEWKIKFEHKI